MDPNTVTAGNYTLDHINSTGGVLDYRTFLTTPPGAWAVATFKRLAVGSAGSVYISVTYSKGLDLSLIQRVQLLQMSSRWSQP